MTDTPEDDRDLPTWPKDDEEAERLMEQQTRWTEENLERGVI